jgi:ATP-dependent DNA helicase RecQ
MKKFTANYACTNHNFVIQNLQGKRISSKYLPAICILKNLLQRGKPTIMSQYLQGVYGALHKQDDFLKPFVLINNKEISWVYTIKGSKEQNYYPARTFFENRIAEDLPEYSYIRQLIVPEIAINDITQSDDPNYEHQCVDFYLPQAQLVIEIDGQQHKLEGGRVIDEARDKHLSLFNVLTVRIDTKDLERRNATYYKQIGLIKEQLEKHSRFLNLYKNNYSNPNALADQEIVNSKLLPTAIIRFQVLVLELLENGYVSLEDKQWSFEVLNQDISGYEQHAIEDIFEWLSFLLKLQKINFAEPAYTVTNVKSFTAQKNIKVDFSLLQRWTDENKLQPHALFVRTDYQDLFYNKATEKLDRINYFRLSTTALVQYKLSFNEEQDDLENLEFFLRNIFEYDRFTPG